MIASDVSIQHFDSALLRHVTRPRACEFCPATRWWCAAGARTLAAGFRDRCGTANRL